jgi:ABC-type uncharacterized transport system substrate-binding protein
MQVPKKNSMPCLLHWPSTKLTRFSSVQFFNAQIAQFAALGIRHGVPVVYQYHPFVKAGGLLSYGSDETEYYRLVGIQAGKILKGEKPADLPVMQSTKVELMINLKTAKALGITVPLSILGRADEVIE